MNSTCDVRGIDRQDCLQDFFSLNDGKLGEFATREPVTGDRFCLGIVLGFEGEGDRTHQSIGKIRIRKRDRSIVTKAPDSN